MQTLIQISDTTCQCAADILREKKEALTAGDESVINGRVGKGKDIMSVLRELKITPYLLGLRSTTVLQ